MANRTYQVTAVILFAFAAYVAFAAMKMRFYTSLGPGPGFFPMFMAGLLALLSVLMFIEATFRPADLPKAPFGDVTLPNLGKIGTVAAALLAFAALMEPVGYPIAATAFVLLMLRIFGVKRWDVSVLAAAIFGLGSYYAFTTLLRVPLPAGVWPF